MNEREALKLAQEALEKCDDALAEELAAWDIDPPLHHVLEASNACGPAITAIKEALAQPEQLISDQINYGMSVTQGGKRIDPMSIYKEPEQEPVAAECKFDTETSWGRCSIEHHNWVQSEPEKWPKYQTRLLYTTPPQRKTLSDEEIILIVADCASSHQHTDIHFARAIEAKLKEKNT